MKVAKTLFMEKPIFGDADFVVALALEQALDITTQKNRVALEAVVEAKKYPTPSNLRSTAVNVCGNFMRLQEPQLTWSAALPPVLAALPGLVDVKLIPAQFKSFAEQAEFAGPWFEIILKLLNAVSVEFTGQTKTDAGLGYFSPALLTWIIVQAALKNARVCYFCFASLSLSLSDNSLMSRSPNKARRKCPRSCSTCCTCACSPVQRSWRRIIHPC